MSFYERRAAKNEERLGKMRAGTKTHGAVAQRLERARQRISAAAEAIKNNEEKWQEMMRVLGGGRPEKSAEQQQEDPKIGAMRAEIANRMGKIAELKNRLNELTSDEKPANEVSAATPVKPQAPEPQATKSPNELSAATPNNRGIFGPEDEKKFENLLYTAHKKILARSNGLSLVSSFGDLWKELKPSMPGLTQDDFKRMVLKMNENGIIDLDAVNSRDVLANDPGLAITTGSGQTKNQLYYVSFLSDPQHSDYKPDNEVSAATPVKPQAPEPQTPKSPNEVSAATTISATGKSADSQQQSRDREAKAAGFPGGWRAVEDFYSTIPVSKLPASLQKQMATAGKIGAIKLYDDYVRSVNKSLEEAKAEQNKRSSWKQKQDAESAKQGRIKDITDREERYKKQRIEEENRAKLKKEKQRKENEAQDKRNKASSWWDGLMYETPPDSRLPKPPNKVSAAPTVSAAERTKTDYWQQKQDAEKAKRDRIKEIRDREERYKKQRIEEENRAKLKKEKQRKENEAQNKRNKKISWWDSVIN